MFSPPLLCFSHFPLFLFSTSSAKPKHSMKLKNVFGSGGYCDVPPSLRSNELDICAHSATASLMLNVPSPSLHLEMVISKTQVIHRTFIKMPECEHVKAKKTLTLFNVEQHAIYQRGGPLVCTTFEKAQWMVFTCRPCFVTLNSKLVALLLGSSYQLIATRFSGFNWPLLHGLGRTGSWDRGSGDRVLLVLGVPVLVGFLLEVITFLGPPPPKMQQGNFFMPQDTSTAFRAWA
ncbi:hypothetical protein BDR22DRAFT_557772 [Usnea florida]